MGGMISFMNTFFMASILICCLLVLMLIYNFRQRLNSLESNYKLTLDMLNNVVQKMGMIENNVSSGGYETQELNIPYVEEQYNLREREESDGEEQGEESDGEESDGEESDGEESDGEEQGEESQGEKVPEFVTVSEISNEFEVEQSEDIDDDNTISTEDGMEMTRGLENDGDFDYDKMNLTQLRAIVKTRGLSTSVSKMKKSDALALLNVVN